MSYVISSTRANSALTSEPDTACKEVYVSGQYHRHCLQHTGVVDILCRPTKPSKSENRRRQCTLASFPASQCRMATFATPFRASTLELPAESPLCSLSAPSHTRNASRNRETPRTRPNASTSQCLRVSSYRSAMASCRAMRTPR